MKKTFILLLTISVFSFFSCTKEKVTPQTNTETEVRTNPAANGKIKNPASNIFTSCGMWHVVSLTREGADLTAGYSALNVVFCPDYTFTVSNDAMSQNGNWFFGAFNDSTIYLHLSYNNPANPWAILQDIWRVNSLEPSRLILQTDDGSKMLTLQKPTK